MTLSEYLVVVNWQYYPRTLSCILGLLYTILFPIRIYSKRIARPSICSSLLIGEVLCSMGHSLKFLYGHKKPIKI